MSHFLNYCQKQQRKMISELRFYGLLAKNTIVEVVLSLLL